MRAILPSTGLLAVMCGALSLGCEAKPGILPNADPNLRKPIKTIRADGVQRAYPSEAPRAKGLAGRAQVGYMAKNVDVANFGDEDWTDVEIWVNETYVCHLPKIEAGVAKSIPFDALFDREGNHVPNRKLIVDTVEVYMGGKLYDLKVGLPHS